MLKALAWFAACIALPAGAAECYSVDAAQGSVSYEVQQAGAPFRGTFRRFGGQICLEAERVTRIEVWLDPASVDSGLPEIDAALKGADFFAVDRYPRVAYTSASVQTRAGAQLARGRLQMKGKSRALEVSFQLQRAGGGLKAAGSLLLDRLDYGIGSGDWSNTDWLSGKVKVEFRAALSAR